MDSCFVPDRQIVYVKDGATKRERYSTFNMLKLKEFLENYIFTKTEEDLYVEDGLEDPPHPSQYSASFEPPLLK